MRYLCLILFLGLHTFGLAQENYYPDRPGLIWTYSNGETQSLGTAAVDGQDALILTHTFEGVPISEETLVYDANGVRMLSTAAGGQVLSYQPFLTVYPPPPLQVGQTWTSTARVADFDISLNAEVVGIRGVQTPVGRFNALQIRQQTITSTGGQTSLDLFFVPSIGVVRFVTQDGIMVDLIEKNF